MTREETKRILMGIKAIFQGFSVDPAVVDMWHLLIGKHSFDVAQAALMRFLNSSASFAPTPGQLNQEIGSHLLKLSDTLESDFKAVWDASSPYQKDTKRKQLSPMLFQIGSELGWDRMAGADVYKDVQWLKKDFLNAYNQARNRIVQELLNDGIKSETDALLELRSDADHRLSGGEPKSATIDGQKNHPVRPLLDSLVAGKGIPVEGKKEALDA